MKFAIKFPDGEYLIRCHHLWPEFSFNINNARVFTTKALASQVRNMLRDGLSGDKIGHTAAIVGIKLSEAPL